MSATSRIDVPHRRALGLNSITSHAYHLTDIRYATISVTIHSQIIRQPRPLSPLCVEGVVPLRHNLTRSKEICARALMLSRLDGTHERRIALVELRHDEMLLPLRRVAGHTTQHSRIGT